MAGGPDSADGGHAGSDVQEEGAAAAAVPERRKGETADEKRARKEAVKEAQRMARVQKKDMRSTFKRAEQVLQRMKATAQPQAAIKLPS
jgi:protein LTV1